MEKSSIQSTISNNILVLINKENKECVRIDEDGKIFWNEREVETDDEFKESMKELKNIFQQLYINQQTGENK